MKISYSKQFIKSSANLNSAQRKQLLARIDLFSINPMSPILRNHALKGVFKDYYSVNITGDLRALYWLREDEVIFDLVGTHSQLYG